MTKGERIIPTIVNGIKKHLESGGHPVVDPLTTMNPYETGAPAKVAGVMASRGKDGPEDSGVEDPELFERILREAEIETRGSVSPPITACQINTLSAIKGTLGSTPTVRNGKGKATGWEIPRAVTFAEDMDVDDLTAKDPLKTTRDAPKKLRLMDTLTTDPDDMVRQVLQTSIAVPLKDLLAIAPELQRRFGKPVYSSDDTPATGKTLQDKQQVIQNNNIQVIQHRDDANPQSNHLGSSSDIPQWVHIEAYNGRIIRAGTRPSGTSFNIPTLPRDGIFQNCNTAIEEEEEKPRTTHARREYDRDHGFEHIRRDCPKAPIMMNDIRLTALLDSGAELNTIRMKTAQAAGLVVTSMPREMSGAKMQAANGSFEAFAGMIWRAPVTIGNIVVHSNFFVVKSLSNPVILGNPYLADAQCIFQYHADGRMKCTIYSADREASATFVGSTDNTLGTIPLSSVTPKDNGA